MYTFSLDEYGDFEGLDDHSKKPVFIAGLIYNDAGDSVDLKNEKKRIKAYYEEVIKTAGRGESGFNYPDALHSKGDAVHNSSVVGPVKNEVAASLGEFLREGTYHGESFNYRNSNGNLRCLAERRGFYYIYIILKSAEGMTNLLRPGVNILSKDEYASNLYFHMASELISRLIFHNPVLRDIKNADLHIATRGSADMIPGSSKAVEYENLGYKNEAKDTKSRVFFRLANADVYRTVLAEETIRSGKTGLKIEPLKVRPISYSNPYKMEFLYLADSVCSILSYRCPGNNEDDFLDNIRKRAESLLDADHILLFAYDEIDRVFAHAWNYYEEGNLYKSLSTLYNGTRQKGHFAAFYKKKWFPLLEQAISQNPDVSAFITAVRKLGESLYNNDLDQDKCFYIFRALEKIIPAVESRLTNQESRAAIYELYDIGLSAYCHIGDSRNAEIYYQKCVDSAYLPDLDVVLSTMMKMAVYYCDYFLFDKAEEIVDEIIQNQELIADMKKEISLPGISASGSLGLAKALSQKGQILAFKREPEADEFFERALNIYKENSANYMITLSYRLHYYLDNGRKDEYEKWAPIYFGGKKRLRDQLNYIIKEGTGRDSLISFKYALYVYARALYEFYVEEITETLWAKMTELEVYIENLIGKKVNLSGHPFELIYKYLCLIAKDRDDKGQAKIFRDKMYECIKNAGDTIRVIWAFADIEFLQQSRSPDVENKCQELMTYLCEHFPESPIAKINSEKNTYEWIKSHLAFMHV